MTPAELVQAGEEALSAAQEGSEAGRAELERLRGPLTELAEDGDTDAQSLLGGIALEYLDDPATAFGYWTRAAAQGNPAAQRGLGYLYVNGIGVERDLDRAASLFRPAAAAGDVYAKFNLAVMDAQGLLPEPLSAEEAEAMLRAAVEHGIVDAGPLLGNVLGRADRDEEALSWYLWSAERGDAQGMYVAACWYRDGFGTEPDPVQAVRWFVTMLQVGNGNGVHAAIELARSMTAEQIEEACRLAGDPASAAALVRTAHPG
jgi:TPR repeat protein